MNRSTCFLAAAAILAGCSYGGGSDHERIDAVKQGAFVNGSFESGTNNVAPPNWTVTAYTNPGVTYPALSRSDLNLGTGGTLATITKTTTNGPESEYDPSLGAGSTLRWPKYGSAVALVNNNNSSGAIANGMLQAMTLTTADIDSADGKPHVRFTVAPVLENPNHAPQDQPYYFVQLRNVTKGTVLYQDYNASAQPGIPWKIANGVNYTDWQLVDIAPGSAGMGVGDQIELEVIASRCAPSGHFGRVYVDGVGSKIPGLFVSGSGPSGANRGNDVTYTLNFNNGGTGAAGNVVVEFHVPDDTTWVGLSAPGYSCTQPAVGQTGTVSCNIGTLSPGASGSITVTVNIAPGSSTNLITAGHYQIAATAVNPLLGPKMYTSVTSGVTYTDLALTKTNNLGGVGWGQQVTYEVEATNNGPSAVTNAIVTDTLPAQLTGASWTCTATGGGSCATASGTGNLSAGVNLPVGAKAKFEILGNIIAGSGSGTISNTASIAAPGGVSDTTSTNNAAADSDPIGILRTISIRKYGDAGTVSSVPQAFSCGAGCSTTSGAFVDGTSVTINAVPGPGETFLGWGGSCSGTATACTFTVGSDTSIYAIFEADPRANGLSCTAGTQCVSGHCIDGVCCDTTCGGGVSDCQSCALGGSVGTCTNASSGTVCAAGSCTNGVATPAATCTGSSPTCGAPTPVSCDGLVCSGATCLGSCANSGDCVSGNYCDAGACKPHVAQGSACSSDNECGTGHCVDGVCCNVGCSGQCEACNLAVAPGVCLPVTGAPVGARTACETDSSVCGGACNGTLRNACAYPSNATTCVAASCTNGEATLRTGCDGSGHCPSATTQDCGDYVCGATACLGDCAVDGDCSNGKFCSGGVCTTERTSAQACDRDGECASGNCVDGVCCDTSCTGQCEACNVEGSEGVCSAVSGDPVGPRAACAKDGSVCDGSCDGNDRTECTYPDSGISCRAASCADDVATLGAVCDGAGSCPPLQTQNCGSFVCGATYCDGDCDVDGDCANGSYCSAGICVGKLTPGAACGGDNQCASGQCVDGVCCNVACTGQCEACDVSGLEGTCSPVSGAPHGARTACATDGSLCGGSCDGSDRTACAFPTETTSCRAPSCTDDVATLAAACNGEGACPDIETQACGDFVCGVSACDGDCARTADCAAGSYCSGGVCKTQLPPGSVCSATDQCASGNCVDGVCCDTACDGQCAACNLPGSEGTCSAVKGSPRGGRAACLGEGECGGTCDGKNTTACAMPGDDVICGALSCENGYEREASRCNAGGLCVQAEAKSCGNYTCYSKSCRTSCNKNRDCVTGFVCDDGACVAPADVKPAKNGGTITGGGCSVSSNGSSAESPWSLALLATTALGFGIARRRRPVGRVA